MTAIWKIQTPVTATDPAQRRQQILQVILKNRGLTTKKSRQQFLNPPPPQQIKPTDLGIKASQLQAALQRLQQAITNQELIYIYGDFDADGVCSTAILWETLHYLGAQVLPFVPVRNSQARGLSPEGVDEILALKPKSPSPPPSLIITVDNGISAFKGVAHAQSKNLDVIITDHHQPKHHQGKHQYPPAAAVIHTTQLAGAGVAWFFSQFLLKKLKPPQTSQTPPATLELAALGTIADMVPLLEANRSLAQHGLAALSQTQRPGLRSLAKLAGLDLKDVGTYQVGFVIAPRLNAMGRLSQALDSVRLLCTPNRSQAKQLAENLHQVNQDRQDLTQTMLAHAQSQWLKQDQSQPLIFISDSSYHEGIVGLVAGRLAEKYSRPAVVVAQASDFSKASARSPEGFNLVKALHQLDQHLLEFGGHQLAAGFSAATKKLPLIHKKLLKLAEKKLKDESLQPQLDIDCQLKPQDITWALFNQLEKLKPFGFANPHPVFVIKGLPLTDFRTVGQDQKHLKLKLADFDAIAFNRGYLAERLTPHQLLDVAFTLDQNIWNGQKSLQLKIKDIFIPSGDDLVIQAD